MSHSTAKCIRSVHVVNNNVHDSYAADDARFVYFSDMNTKCSSGTRLKAERERLGLSMSQLAARTKTISKSRINNYENGHRSLGVDVAKELAAALGCTPAYLLCMEEQDGNTASEAALDIRRDETETGLWRLIESYKALPPEKREQLVGVAEEKVAEYLIENHKKRRLAQEKKTG